MAGDYFNRPVPDRQKNGAVLTAPTFTGGGKRKLNSFIHPLDAQQP
jgi:hypothetical protein